MGDAIEQLMTIAEISVVLAGFAGIISTFRQFVISLAGTFINDRNLYTTTNKCL